MLGTRHTLIAACATLAACGHDGTPTGPGTTPSISGVLAIVGPAPAQPLQLTFKTGTRSFTTVTDSAGDYHLNAALGAPGDPIDVIVDAPPGDERTYHPVLARGSVQTVRTLASRPLVVPRISAFSTATYPNASVAVSLESAFAPVCLDFTNANCNSFFPQLWLDHVALWPESAFPIPLAFDHTASTDPITADDSVALWHTVDQMNAALGRELFRPADVSDLPTPRAGYSNGAVLIRLDRTLTLFSATTNWRYDANYDMFEAQTRVISEKGLASSSLMTHELLHALGFHHTCAWPTVMGGYGCKSASGATLQDAAAFQLAFAIRRTILSRAPSTTLGDALRGEQSFETVVAASRVARPRVFADSAP